MQMGLDLLESVSWAVPVRLRGGNFKNDHTLFSVSCCVLQTAAATSTVAGAMQSAAGAMSAVGGLADPIKMQQQMAAFARENERLDMASDMMDDGLFEDEDEDEADDIVDQVCCASEAHTTRRGDMCRGYLICSFTCEAGLPQAHVSIWGCGLL